MKRKFLIALGVIIVLVSTMILISSMKRSKAREALATYKAELRSKGETLTFDEAGYPFPLETNSGLENFVALADQLGTQSTIPGAFNVMPFDAPGRAIVTWAGNPPKLWDPASNSPSSLNWNDLASDIEAVSEPLSEIRAELEHPPRYFGWNYTNPFAANQPRSPFIQKRIAAQFLSADCLVALHAGESARAQSDLHALTQLVQVHRSDLTLVSAMVRVAISALGLKMTWEALPASGWDEASLAALQHDWEGIDLLDALETGFVGDRMFGQQVFKLVRQSDLEEQRSMISFSPGSTSTSLKDQIMGKGVMIYWRGHMDEDELFYLRDSQERLETIRKLRSNTSGAALKLELQAQYKALERELDSPMGKYRHLFSATAIPNFQRAFDTCIQREAERRMTITAIALKRFHLRNGHYPEALSELVPQYCKGELIDPWSGKPFRYRLNADDSFMLYSVGMDGLDDGGDPEPVSPGKSLLDLWSGKDAVWPSPVFPQPPE